MKLHVLRLPLSDLQGRIETLEALQDNLKNSRELKDFCCDVYEQRKEQAIMLAQALHEHYSVLEARDVVREGVACIVDAQVAGKLLKAAAAVLKNSSKYCARQITRIRQNEGPLLAIVGTHGVPAAIVDEALYRKAKKHLPNPAKNPTVPSNNPGSREIVLPKVATYEQARNQALDIIGKVEVHSGTPYVGKLEWVKEKLLVEIGMAGSKNSIRL